jgi:nucleoside-diphosphate-sugar epimerase
MYTGKMQKTILITGAAGFLGGRAAKYFGNQVEYKVITTSRRALKKEELEANSCTFIQGDLEEYSFCEKLTNEVDIIIHCAALSSPFGFYEHFYASNVVATENLLKAGKKNGVKQFIFISTPSIYFTYKDRFNIKESDPLPEKMVNDYAITKLMAEKMVLDSNEANFKTLALRPRAIIGAEDTVIFPRMLEAYHQGKLKIVGDGKNVCDFTCVRNVIHAMECAINAPENAYGEAYNISDGNPSELWPSIQYTLKELGLTPPSKKVPVGIALFAAGIIEFIAKNLQGGKEPAMTKYGIGILSKSMTMDISKARELLKYQPIMTTKEGIKEFTEWQRKQK